jgi:hypothetical protein
MKMIMGKLMKREILGDLKNNRKFKNKANIFILRCTCSTTQAFSDFLNPKTLPKNLELDI